VDRCFPVDLSIRLSPSRSEVIFTLLFECPLEKEDIFTVFTILDGLTSYWNRRHHQQHADSIHLILSQKTIHRDIIATLAGRGIVAVERISALHITAVHRVTQCKLISSVRVGALHNINLMIGGVKRPMNRVGVGHNQYWHLVPCDEEALQGWRAPQEDPNESRGTSDEKLIPSSSSEEEEILMEILVVFISKRIVCRLSYL